MSFGSPDYTNRNAAPTGWQPISDTATVTPATITFDGVTVSVYVENTGDTNNLYYSLDSGTNWVELVPGQNKGLDIAASDIQLKTLASTTTYLVEVTYG